MKFTGQFWVAEHLEEMGAFESAKKTAYYGINYNMYHSIAQKCPVTRL